MKNEFFDVNTLSRYTHPYLNGDGLLAIADTLGADGDITHYVALIEYRNLGHSNRAWLHSAIDLMSSQPTTFRVSLRSGEIRGIDCRQYMCNWSARTREVEGDELRLRIEQACEYLYE